MFYCKTATLLNEFYYQDPEGHMNRLAFDFQMNTMLINMLLSSCVEALASLDNDIEEIKM